MRKQPFIPLCAVILLCCVLGPLPAYSEGGDPLSEARANIERAHQELEGAFSAKKRGDLDAAKRYQQETMRLLREARALYLEFLDSHPGDVAVTLEYADLLAQTGDFDLAAE
ncbi:MAG: hypothetical protein JXR94_19335, partial [Candidatus Hydrogenedentes bacterium]|nr:hypothetical protein [Candidatus Hydrogenedentota bacterium]